MAPADSNRALFALWGLFWLLMVVVAIEDNRGNSHIKWWEPLVWEGSSCIVATFWFALQRRVAECWNEHLDNPLRWFGKQLMWLPLMIPTFIFAVYAMRHAAYALTSEVYEHNSWRFLFPYESIKLLLFAGLWICITFGFASFAQWRQERERLLALQKHLAESQLAQLKAQLQPHFLFNSLNTISALMQVDVGRADHLLTRLADLLRSSLQVSARHMTSLREELKLLELYAQIMEERFAGRAVDAGYPVYILHQTVIIVIAFTVIQQPWRPWTKYWVVLGATLLTCVLLHEFLLRRFAVLRVAFGIKTHKDARVSYLRASVPRGGRSAVE